MRLTIIQLNAMNSTHGLDSCTSSNAVGSSRNKGQKSPAFAADYEITGSNSWEYLFLIKSTYF